MHVLHALVLLSFIKRLLSSGSLKLRSCIQGAEFYDKNASDSIQGVPSYILMIHSYIQGANVVESYMHHTVARFLRCFIHQYNISRLFL